MKSYPKIRLFVESPLAADQVLMLEEEQAHYLARVMRGKAGDDVAIFNGADGEWRATVEDIAKKHVTVRMTEQLREHIPTPDVWACFAPIKFGKIDFMIQKMTELGAAKIQPVMTQYTQSERVNMKRLRSNAIEAAEQCERVEVPQMEEPVKLRELLADWPEDRLLIYADEQGDGVEPKEWLPTADVKKWGILVGPEGGFAPEERELLYKMPFVKGISLGPRIMRADTAAIALLTLTQSWFGDWHIAPHFSFGS